MIEDLQAKIAGIKARGERKRARQNPAVRQVLIATKALDRALQETKDGVLRGAVEEARVTLAACLGTQGIVLPQIGTVPTGKPRGRRPKQIARQAS